MERTPLQKGFSEWGCFGCAGEEHNPVGLNLVFEETEGGALTRFTLSKSYSSYPGFLHGGVLTAVLDETMGYVGVFKRGVIPFTKTLSTRFRKGLKADTEYVCEATLLEQGEDWYKCRGVIREGKRRLVSCDGAFVLPDKELAASLMDEEHVDSFKDFLR